LGAQVDVALVRPLSKHTEEVAQAFLGIKPVQWCNRAEAMRENKWPTLVLRSSLPKKSHACFSSDGNSAQLALGMGCCRVAAFRHRENA